MDEQGVVAALVAELKRDAALAEAAQGDALTEGAVIAAREHGRAAVVLRAAARLVADRLGGNVVVVG